MTGDSMTIKSVYEYAEVCAVDICSDMVESVKAAIKHQDEDSIDAAWESIAQLESDFSDYAIEFADNSEFVIYYGKAHFVCREFDTSEAESMIEDGGGFGEGFTYDSMACQIAFWVMYQLICDAIQENIGAFTEMLETVED